MTRVVQRRRPLRWWTTGMAVVLSTALGPAAVASADPGVLAVGQAVVNTQVQETIAADATARIGAAVEVRQFVGENLRADNRALATARECRDCRAVAVTYQVVVLIAQNPDIRATNLAEAVNVRCEACESLAAAYQYVVVSNRALRFDARATADLERIERAADEIRHSMASAPLGELQSALDALSLQVVQVLMRVLEESRADEAAGPSMPPAGPPIDVRRDIRFTVPR